MPTHHLETGDGPGDELRETTGSSHLWTKSSKGRQFRICLPNEEDDDIEDVQRAGPMLFSKYRAQNRQSSGINDFSRLSASGVQTGQNVLPKKEKKC